MITGFWIDRGKGEEVSRVCVWVCMHVCVGIWLICCFEKREKSERKRKDLDAFSELHNSRGVWAVLWSTHSDKLSLHPGLGRKRQPESEEVPGQVRTLITHIWLHSSWASQPAGRHSTWRKQLLSYVQETPSGKHEAQVNFSVQSQMHLFNVPVN